MAHEPESRETPGRHVPRLTKRDWSRSTRRAWCKRSPLWRAGSVGRSCWHKTGGELSREPEPSVKAVLGHWLLGYIHPYPDGNGRIARFLMNAMLASGGYPWTVIRISDRESYLTALDSASIDQEIGPFARFVAERVQWSRSSQLGVHRHRS
ncbi:MAG: hypothetical protein F4X12_17205 [Acidobacteriia bacterium]|nr:hypothetical protein [Terriglobia bacterium]